jgi:CRISPR/Cas system-associated endonuclease Cas3-HD
MIKDKNKQNSEKELTNKLDSFLKKQNKECNDQDCLINNPEEIVKRENKKIITNDGRQLLNEYTN